jgi:hypothetical protein
VLDGTSSTVAREMIERDHENEITRCYAIDLVATTVPSKPLNSQVIKYALIKVDDVYDNLWQAARNLLI